MKRRIRGRMVVSLLIAAVASVGLVSAAAGQQGSMTASDAILALTRSSQIEREVTLKELGFSAPVLLSGADSRREIYLPVPAGVAIADASLDFKGHYLRTDGGRASLMLSLDGSPTWATAFTQNRGNLDVPLPIDGAPRRSGFVRLDAAWSSWIADTLCGPEHLVGNVVAIDPATRFRYRYSGDAVRDLATAWTALPIEPVVLVASRALTRDSYDVAWRIGVTLERAGKHAVIRALPAIGDVVDTTGVVVPESLKAIPAIEALSRGEKRAIANNAEVGALLLLGAADLRADMVVADDKMATVLALAIEALSAQIATATPGAMGAFAEWRKRWAGLMEGGGGNATIRLASVGGRPAIAVASRAGPEAAALFNELWRRIALSKSLVVNGLESGADDGTIVPLARLGGAPGPFDVLARGDWTATFDLGNVTRGGRIPVELVVDVSAAPGAALSSPVASVVLNDVLLGAKRLNSEGTPERITSRIPPHILAPRNVLRVSFQRQPLTDRCREIPQAYPANVLPSSHLRLEPSTPADDFSGMIARFAEQAELIVPASFLTDAPASLGMVIRLADATGLSPEDAQFTVVGGRAPAIPRTSFLAIEVGVRGVQERSDGGRLDVARTTDKKVANIAGFDFIGIAEVVRSGDHYGIYYRKVGENAPQSVPPFRLGRGDIAVIGPQGPITQMERGDLATGTAVSGWREWLPGLGTINPLVQRGLNWGVFIFIGAVVVIAGIMLAARFARRRARAKQQ